MYSGFSKSQALALKAGEELEKGFTETDGFLWIAIGNKTWRSGDSLIELPICSADGGGGSLL